jgi:molybdate transport system substrate-binding protein
MNIRTLVVALATFLSLVSPAHADEVAVAVASNFLGSMRQLAASFEKATGHRVVISSGSTGKLAAQIIAGAPFDLFFAADATRPQRLEKEGVMVAGSRFTYAIGKLTLASAAPDGAVGPASLSAGAGKIAVAHPKMAPYGMAAMQVMEKIVGKGAFESRLVFAESVSQALHYVTTGAADIGFVALSQLRGNGNAAIASSWVVPTELYDPIAQQGGMLRRGENNETAKAFLAYIKGEDGRRRIQSFGYTLP